MRGHWIWFVPASLILVACVLWANGMLGLNDADELKKSAATGLGPAPVGAEKATFGAGCFWCTEAVFQQLKGVHGVQSGYSGGTVKNPTYEQVCRGRTGHAEVIQITFDPKVISYAELLEVFWQTHDPTTLNRQGNDRGPQYRSAVFYHTPKQKRACGTVQKETRRCRGVRGAHCHGDCGFF